MSTRCQIGFYYPDSQNVHDFTTLLYRHHDGYPEYIVPVLKELLEDCVPRIGWDIEYLAGSVIAKMNRAETHIGVSSAFHGDIEYMYVVRFKEIAVFKVDYDEDDVFENGQRFMYLESIPLTLPEKWMKTEFRC